MTTRLEPREPGMRGASRPRAGEFSAAPSISVQSPIGIIGARGAVGREALAILAERSVPAEAISLFSTQADSKASLDYRRTTLPLQPLTAEALGGLRWCLLTGDRATAERWAPVALEQGATVVDNSSAFRMNPDVPLVVPEINGELLAAGPRLVANPNCSTTLLLVALEPLRRRFGIAEIQVATYQAVSGAGAAAIDELLRETASDLRGDPLAPQVFPEPCAFNVFCHESAVDPVSGHCEEESKIVAEARKIWRQSDLTISPFCVRVPVLRAHSQAVWVRLRQPACLDELRAAIAAGAGVQPVDDRPARRFPTPRAASGKNDVLVGRIRPSSADGGDDPRTDRWSLFLSGDQLRKGAALNALQIIDAIHAASAERRSP